MNPKIYLQAEHNISLTAIDPQALHILEKLRDAGYIAYLVGGSVRDLLFGKKPKDFDISTSAKPEEIRLLFPSAILIGKRFRLAHVRFGKKVIEVSTFRAGDIENDILITEDNIWGSPEEDAMRRDFTINALFYDSAEQKVIDYVGGYRDVRRKYLQTIGRAALRFKQDPVRMIRCLKFQARFALEVDEKTYLALISCRGEIVKSSHARVLEEMLRVLESASASPFFALATEYGILQTLLPTLASFLQRETGGKIHLLLREIDRSLRETPQNKIQRPVLLSALLFPMFEEHLQSVYVDRDNPPPFAAIDREAYAFTKEVFFPFLRLPRSLREGVFHILVLQYRMVRFSEKKRKKCNLVKACDFPLALRFLGMRLHLNPELREIEKAWHSIYQKFLQSNPPPHEKPNRRKKQRRGKGWMRSRRMRKDTPLLKHVKEGVQQ